MLLFCDWLSIYQVHYADVPVVNEGRIFSISSDGEVMWEVNSKVVFKGSFDTSVRVVSDGHRVVLEGNVGRFGRSDNVFGYSVQDCVRLASKIVALFGLPPFTDSAPMSIVRPGVLGDVGSAAYFKSDTDAGFLPTGSVITRVDLTCNYSTGSSENASQYVRWLAGFKLRQMEPRSYQTSGVSWGEGSKFWYAKVYDKAADYIRHRSVAHSLHDASLYAWLKTSGVVRHEITLKSRYLRQNGLYRFSLWDAQKMANVYALFTDVVSGQAHVDSYLEIPGRAGELAVAWRDGADLKKRLSLRTFYRYRRELLQYSIDIAVVSSVERLATRVNVIDVCPLSLPDWYDLPQVDVVEFEPLIATN